MNWAYKQLQDENKVLKEALEVIATAREDAHFNLAPQTFGELRQVAREALDKVKRGVV